MSARLLAGPALERGPEHLAHHEARLGPLPSLDGEVLLGELEASGLLGRGGAGFPVARKWRAVAERSAGDATVLANGAEGEPLSAKDRTLMAARPHLVIDGALLAARAVGATRVMIYVGEGHRAAREAIVGALVERRSSLPVTVRVLDAPDTYVGGEASAAVHFVNAANARPMTTPPRTFERGIDGRPTLVQNVESLAHAALIARHGAGWFREAGRGSTPGTALITLSGSPRSGVTEIDLGTPLAEVAALAGVERESVSAVLLGGYFGGWLRADRAWAMPLDPSALRAAGSGFGCGVISFLDTRACGVGATAQIMGYMAGQSAAQCGPCVYGLRAISDALSLIAQGSASPATLDRIRRWAADLPGRGACHHPDGAVGQLDSALRAFPDDFQRHVHGNACRVQRHAAEAAA